MIQGKRGRVYGGDLRGGLRRAIAKARDGRRGAFISPPICAELSPSLTDVESGRSATPLIPWNLAMNFVRVCAGQLAGETAAAALRLIIGSDRDRKGRN